MIGSGDTSGGKPIPPLVALLLQRGLHARQLALQALDLQLGERLVGGIAQGEGGAVQWPHQLWVGLGQPSAALGTDAAKELGHLLGGEAGEARTRGPWSGGRSAHGEPHHTG